MDRVIWFGARPFPAAGLGGQLRRVLETTGSPIGPYPVLHLSAGNVLDLAAEHGLRVSWDSSTECSFGLWRTREGDRFELVRVHGGGRRGESLYATAGISLVRGRPRKGLVVHELVRAGVTDPWRGLTEVAVATRPASG